MRIPKEIRQKIEQKLKLDDEISDWIKENLDAEDMCFESIEIVNYPTGREQCNGEWCNQSVGYCGDDFYGYYYWPMDNGQYLCMYYEC